MGHPWIGLLRHQDKKFYTIFGTTLSYTNWAPGEPSSPNFANCGHFWPGRGKWDDDDCATLYRFICQNQRCKFTHLFYFI